MNRFFTFVLIANVNAFVQNVLSTVKILLTLGKHKDHDVKTIKKASPLVKTELEKSVDKIESSIENLLIRKSEVEKSIRNFNEQNGQQKRQIQTAFE